MYEAKIAAPSFNTNFLPIARRRLISSPDVSRGELLLFRLIERLAAGRAGCVLNFATLASMLERCERQAWTLFGRLVKAGWVAYRTYRKGGKSYFEFWPLVRVSERSQPVFERTPRLAKTALSEPLHGDKNSPVSGDFPPSDGSFFGQKTAPTTALSTPENCTLVEGPFKTLLTPKGGRQQTASVSPEASTESQTDSVAVSLFQKEVSLSEAQELAKEAARKQLTKEQIERVIAAYQGQLSNIRNRGAWLREAIRRGFSPASPAATHASDLAGSLPVAKKVRVKFDESNGGDPKHQPNVKSDKPQTGESIRAAMRAKMGLKPRV